MGGSINKLIIGKWCSACILHKLLFKCVPHILDVFFSVTPRFLDFLIHDHVNFLPFVQAFKHLCILTLQDTVRAIWHSRHEFLPDEKILFESQLYELAKISLKSSKLDPFTRTKSERKKKQANEMFKPTGLDTGDDDDFDKTYIELGSMNNVLVSLESEIKSDVPKGYRVSNNKAILKNMMYDCFTKATKKNKKFKSVSYIKKDRGGTETYRGGYVELAGNGKDPENWCYIAGNGREDRNRTAGTFYTQDNGSNQDADPAYHVEEAKHRYRKFQDNTRALAALKIQPNDVSRVVEESSDGTLLKFYNHKSFQTGAGGQSKIYYNLNEFERRWKQEEIAEKGFENRHPLTMKGGFFERLAYRHDGITISYKEGLEYIKGYRQVFEERTNSLGNSPIDTSKRKTATMELQQHIRRIHSIMACTEEEARQRDDGIMECHNRAVRNLDAVQRANRLVELNSQLQLTKNMQKRMKRGIGLTILLAGPFMGKTIDPDTLQPGKRVCVPQISHAVTILHSEKIQTMKRANRPSAKACKNIRMPISEAKNDTTTLSLPINQWAWMKRAKHYLLLPNSLDSQENEPEYYFKALYDMKPQGQYYYRKGCMDRMNSLAHDDTERRNRLDDDASVDEGGYLFDSNYPKSAAFFEYMSYDHEYDTSKEKGHRWSKRVPKSDFVVTELPADVWDEVHGAASSLGGLSTDFAPALPLPQYESPERQRLMAAQRQQSRAHGVVETDEHGREYINRGRVGPVNVSRADLSASEFSGAGSSDGEEYSAADKNRARMEIDEARRNTHAADDRANLPWNLAFSSDDDGEEWDDGERRALRYDSAKPLNTHPFIHDMAGVGNSDSDSDVGAEG